MRRTIARELIDDPIADPDELAGNLRDIARANRTFGAYRPIVRPLLGCGVRTVLDVGSGAGDVPLALVRAARAAGVELAVTCLDASEEMLAFARTALAADTAFAFVHGDGTALPFASGAFDAVICTLALHHFEPAAARALLREMRRVARRTTVVCDLRRGLLPLVAVWLWSRFSRNRLTRHDAPLSVRRAYTPGEALALATAAGWRSASVRREPLFRMTLQDGP